MQWLLTAHVRHYHQHYRLNSHVWQGQLRIERDDHLLTVLQYVERNPLRAGLVERIVHSMGSILVRCHVLSVGLGGLISRSQPLSWIRLGIGQPKNATVQPVGFFVWQLSLV
jgi:hypothetical protein